MGLAGCVGAEPNRGPTPTDDAAPAPVPLLVNATFNGTLLCGAGTPQGTLNPCVGQNLFHFEVAPGLQTLLVGIDWDPVTPLAETLYLAIETRGYGGLTNPPDAHRYWADNVQPGHVVRIDNGTAESAAHDWDALQTNTTLQIRIFPGRTLPPTVTADQDFRVQVVAAYGAPAPSPADAGTHHRAR